MFSYSNKVQSCSHKSRTTSLLNQYKINSMDTNSDCYLYGIYVSMTIRFFLKSTNFAICPKDRRGRLVENARFLFTQYENHFLFARHEFSWGLRKILFTFVNNFNPSILIKTDFTFVKNLFFWLYWPNGTFCLFHKLKTEYRWDTSTNFGPKSYFCITHFWL